MTKAFFISCGILILIGLALMVWNFIERPTTNDTGSPDGQISGREREWYAPWTREMDRLNHKMRKWWEW